MAKLSVLVPVFNDAGLVGRTVREFHSALEQAGVDHEIIAIHGRSQDNSEEILKGLSTEIDAFRYMNEEPPYGFGHAIRRGLDNFTGDAVALVMADYCDGPADLVAFWRKFNEGYDCVFGNRFVRGGSVKRYPAVKLVINRVFNLCLCAIFRIKYTDLTNSFKLYSRKFIEDVAPLQSEFNNITIELPLKAILGGYRFAVVPNSWADISRQVSLANIRTMAIHYCRTAYVCYRDCR